MNGDMNATTNATDATNNTAANTTNAY
jgi:hypothetical protein